MSEEKKKSSVKQKEHSSIRIILTYKSTEFLQQRTRHDQVIDDAVKEFFNEFRPEANGLRKLEGVDLYYEPLNDSSSFKAGADHYRRLYKGDGKTYLIILNEKGVVGPWQAAEILIGAYYQADIRIVKLSRFARMIDRHSKSYAKNGKEFVTKLLRLAGIRSEKTRNDADREKVCQDGNKTQREIKTGDGPGEDH